MSSEVHAIEPMFISDEVSGGGIAGDLLPLPDHDEPYEAEPPAETPPDVSFDDSDADDEADKSPVTGLGAVASIACEAAASLPQEGVQSMFQGSFDQGGRLAATAPLLLLKRGLQNMAGENTVALERMFCSNLLAPKTPILAKLDKRMG